jgi:uncharacterized protein (TIGR02246 family)
MKTRFWWPIVLVASMFCPVLAAGRADAQKDNPGDKDAIAKRAEEFVEAFHKGDGKVVAAFWAADGDYTDVAGRKLVGREAIEKSFAEFFAENKGLKMRIESESLRFLTPEVAVEDGVTLVLPPTT